MIKDKTFDEAYRAYCDARSVLEDVMYARDSAELKKEKTSEKTLNDLCTDLEKACHLIENARNVLHDLIMKQ